MTETPPVPRSRRNLNDLDSLIDASIGKGDAYGTAPDQSAKLDETSNLPSPASNDHSSSIPQSSSEQAVPIFGSRQTTSNERSAESVPERFRISIDASVIMATKMLAVQQKTSPSEIVERALRNFLKLPARE